MIVRETFLDEKTADLIQIGWVKFLLLGDEHPHTLESWHNLIELYEAWDKPDEAAKWKEGLRIVD